MMLNYIEEFETLKREAELAAEKHQLQCQETFDAKTGLMEAIDELTAYAVPLETNRHYGAGCWLTEDILLTNAHVISDQLALDMLQIDDMYLEPQPEKGIFFRRPSTLGYYPDQFISKMKAAGPKERLEVEFDEYDSADGSYFFYIDPHQSSLEDKIHFVTPEDASKDLLKLKLHGPHKKENGQSGAPLFEAKLMITGSNTSHWQIRLLGLVFGYDKDNNQILAFQLRKELEEVYQIVIAKDHCQHLKKVSFFSPERKVGEAQSEHQLLVSQYESGVCDSEIILPPNVEPLIDYKDVKMLRVDESVLIGKKSPIADKDNLAPDLLDYTTLEGFNHPSFKENRERIARKEWYRKRKQTAQDEAQQKATYRYSQTNKKKYEGRTPLTSGVLTLKTSLELLFHEMQAKDTYEIPLDTSQLNKERKFFNNYFRLGESVMIKPREEYKYTIKIDIQDQTKGIKHNMQDTKKKSSFTMACTTFKFKEQNHVIYIKDKPKGDKKTSYQPKKTPDANKKVGYYNAPNNSFIFDTSFVIKCLRESKHRVGETLYNDDEKRERCVVEYSARL
tara:strand:- start:193 stop:1878 length:1686 start_codon:yes stop_codon:yes gene_type:complete